MHGRGQAPSGAGDKGERLGVAVGEEGRRDREKGKEERLGVTVG